MKYSLSDIIKDLLAKIPVLENRINTLSTKITKLSQNGELYEETSKYVAANSDKVYVTAETEEKQNDWSGHNSGPTPDSPNYIRVVGARVSYPANGVIHANMTALKYKDWALATKSDETASASKRNSMVYSYNFYSVTRGYTPFQLNNNQQQEVINRINSRLDDIKREFSATTGMNAEQFTWHVSYRFRDEWQSASQQSASQNGSNLRDVELTIPVDEKISHDEEHRALITHFTMPKFLGSGLDTSRATYTVTMPSDGYIEVDNISATNDLTGVPVHEQISYAFFPSVDYDKEYHLAGEQVTLTNNSTSIQFMGHGVGGANNERLPVGVEGDVYVVPRIVKPAHNLHVKVPVDEMINLLAEQHKAEIIEKYDE